MPMRFFPAAMNPAGRPAPPRPMPTRRRRIRTPKVLKTEIKKARQTTAGPKRGNPNVNATRG